MPGKQLTYPEFLRLIATRSPYDEDSENPINKAIEMLQGKWKIRVLFELSKSEKFRYNELRKRIPAITNTMLTSTLRELASDGLVERTQFNEIPPRVEYSLSARGRELLPVFYEIFKWAQNSLGQQPGDTL